MKRMLLAVMAFVLIFGTIAGFVQAAEPIQGEPAIETSDQFQTSHPSISLSDPALDDSTEFVQYTGSEGNVQSPRYGPQRNDPTAGIPEHAYSPFDKQDSSADPCPPGGCEIADDHVVVKMAPQMGLSGADAAEGLTVVEGITGLNRVFPNAKAPQPGQMILSTRGDAMPKPDLTRWYRAQLDGSLEPEAVVDALLARPDVDYAEPDYLRKPVGTPSLRGLTSVPSAPSTVGLMALPGSGTDPLYDQQWHLGAANVPQAWQWLEDHGFEPGGSRDIVVAVIDTGVDYTHPDLAGNMWINPAEFNGDPGVDDDGNGYVDDIYGADTVYPDGDPIDDHGHGTHVAGIIAAQANNSEGGVGIAYNTQIMALKAAQYSGVLAASDIAEAIHYAVEKGADVINMSFGGYARSQVEEDALAVAFGQAVLVGAAGNDGKINLPCPLGRDMYPAAYNWVLGVMASTPSGSRATFSNYDCNPQDSHEYELMAPGADVWSTLPNEQYAAWDGTSMAAPVVSGIAALLRTRWYTKTVFSSRFIMGQVASNVSGGVGGLVDANAALTMVPEPEITYLEHWLFDTGTQSAENDDDGIVDAGETVDLGIVIRNHWGKADPVTVTLEAWADGAVQPDPYVTMITDTVSYGAVGSFNIDDNGLIYENDVVTGVDHPFRFTVPITTPNDHVIPFRLTLEAGNGYDSGDPNAPYVFEDRFYLIVQRGRELPRIIDQDMTLTKDYYYLVPDATLIEEGVTVTVTEGAQVQFWSADPDDPYSQDARPYLQVEGSLLVQGTAEEPVEFFSGALYPGYTVDIRNRDSAMGTVIGEVELRYLRALNPRIQATLIDHCYFAQELFDCIYTRDEYVTEPFCTNPEVDANTISNSIFDKLGSEWGGIIAVSTGNENLYDANDMSVYGTGLQDSVFLKNYKLYETQWGDREYWVSQANGLGHRIYPPTFLRTVFPVQDSGKTYVTLQRPYNSDSEEYLDFAELFANQFGGHVVTINDATENEFLRTYWQDTLTESNFEQTYPDMDCGDATCWNLFHDNPTIGLNDRETEGQFEWISGEPVTYTNWGPGEPDNGSSYGMGDEDFVQMAIWTGTWEDTTSVGPVILELPGTVAEEALETMRQQMITDGRFNTVKGNAFLNVWWDPNIDHWMQFDVQASRDYRRYINDNYWGTTNTTLINAAIQDYNDDFNDGLYVYQPILTEAPESAYPFVADVRFSTDVQTDTLEVGAETVTFTVSFNRDMDTTVQPAVSFGPDVPETDYTVFGVDGGWLNPRTWIGTVDITPVTGDGYQFMRIAGAVAADDPWLITGDDSERFRFEVLTSGSEAMNLQGTGGEGYVDLMWTQDDFDLLAGFNLYRATSLTGTTYTRLNDSIIPPDQRTFRDTDVQPGQPYYYYFKVVKSDLTESDPSNTTTATPVDTIAPVISHTPVTEAPPGLPLSLYADVTDNVAVQNVTLYYRAMGASTYLSRTMTHTTGDRYSATLEGSRITSPGLEYYIEASDGVSTARDGRPDYPNQVLVEDKPTITNVNPDHGPTSGGTEITLSGSNLKDGATVTFGGAVAEDVTVLSSNQITCTTPAHFPETVDVVITNPDDQSGTLLRGFTYESDTAVVGLPDVESGQHSVVQVPINVANVEGLAAADVTVTFDASVLSAQGADTGTLTPGWTLAANTNTPGQITLSMASSGGTASGSGVLANLQFEVIGTPAMTSTLEIVSVSFNDGAIPVQSNDGSFMVSLVYRVMGDVSFWQDGAPISGTLLSLVGDRLYSTESQVDGTYTVTNVPEGDYTLTPSKSGDVDGITAYDASLVLQHAAGLSTLSGYAFTAGDVNKSGQITSMDAFYILQKAVDLITLPFTGAGVIWDFDPESRSYTGLSSDRTGQDFTGVLIGDVSGNWTANVLNHSQAPAPNAVSQSMTATLSLSDTTVLPGAQVTLPLSLDLPEGRVYGVDLTTTYDPAVISVVQVTKGAAVTNWSLATNTGTPGEVRVALAGATPLETEGELLNFVFEAVGTAGTSSDLDLTEGAINEGAIPTNLDDGHLAVATPAVADFTASPTSGGAPLTVDFTNTSTGDYTESTWSFGDGMTSTLESPTHTYMAPGTYTVELTISGSGGTDTETKADLVTVQVYEVTGTVQFWKDGSALDGVEMTLLGSQTYTTTSGTDGTYAISGINTGAYTLTPDKSDDVRGISAYDASYVLRHAAGLLTLTGEQASAADVDQSGIISAMDASYVLQKAVGLIDVPFPDAEDVWVFNPPERSYANVNSDLTNQDFTGVLLGDVSGNWASVGTQTTSAGEPPITVAVQGYPLSSDNVVTATVWLDAEAAVYGLDLRLIYDPEVATLLAVSNGTMAEDMQLATNTATAGEIRAAIAGAESITGEGKVLLLTFHLQDASASTILDPIWGEANEGESDIELRSDLIGSGYEVFLPLVTRTP